MFTLPKLRFLLRLDEFIEASLLLFSLFRKIKHIIPEFNFFLLFTKVFLLLFILFKKIKPILLELLFFLLDKFKKISLFEQFI